MGRLRTLWHKPRSVRWFVAALCFALGLLAGWLLAGCWFDRWSGLDF